MRRHLVAAVACLAPVAVVAGCTRGPATSPSGPSPLPRALVIESACDRELVDCSVPVGSERTFSAVVVYSDGSRQTQETAWVSEDPSVAGVDAGGRVVGLRRGTTTVRATAASLTARRAITVVPRRVGAWKGRAVARRCNLFGQFEAWWCDEPYRVGNRMHFELHLQEEDGRLTGGIAIDLSGGGLTLDEGASLDAEGRLRLSARGEGGLGFIGPFTARIDPLRAQVRGASLEGSFVMTVTATHDTPIEGSVVVEADLEGVALVDGL